jgi:hypothetical protein
MNTTTADTMLTERPEAQGGRYYTVAGWCAFGAAALVAPGFLVSLSVDTVLRSGPTRVAALLALTLLYAAQVSMGVLAMIRLRRLFNERFEFHRLDTVISLLIAGVIAITATALTGRILLPPGDVAMPLTLIYLVPILVFGIGMGVLSLIFGFRLLELDEDPYRLFKLYAYLSIAGGLCYVSVVLIPLGGLLVLANYVLLGILFLRAAEDTEPVVDFV